ncbi:carbonic anhydrase [Ceratobasidium sp. AG-Ba]|nr:carbonic anhydrase [Ceratobasidium sp. AG-Ba]
MRPGSSHIASLARASARSKCSPTTVVSRSQPLHNFPFAQPRPESRPEQRQTAPSEEPRYKTSGLFAPAAAPRSPPPRLPPSAHIPSGPPPSLGLPYFDPLEEMSEAALAPLIAGNAKWADEVRTKYPTFFADAAKGQSPKVLWIGCADSRVPESTVLGCKPGDVFVHRNIANQFPPEDDSALAVLTYAVENLGVEHIVIAGHTQCGGAAACHAAAQNLGSAGPATTPLARWLGPLTQLAASLAQEKNDAHDTSAELSTLVEANVRKQVDNVVETDVIQRAWAAGKKGAPFVASLKKHNLNQRCGLPVYVHGWVYVIETGTIKDLKVTVNPPAY